MYNKVVRALATWADHFVCIYCGAFTGTYAEVQAHQAAEHGYGKPK